MSEVLKKKQGEVVRAGKLLARALFGDHEEVAEELRDDILREQSEKGGGVPLTTTGFSFVRCAGCAREQAIAPDVDVRELERVGWRLDAGAWRCRFCVGK